MDRGKYSIVGVGQQNDLIYFTGTYKSPLEKHLYTLPIVKPSSSSSQWNNVASDNDDDDGGVAGVRRSFKNVMNSLGGGGSKRRMKVFSSYTHPQPVSSARPPNPLRLTSESGMHSVTMI